MDKNVAITAEGDSGFYSSVNYMFDKLASMGLPITTVAGVPAFIAAGAISGLHIVKPVLLAWYPDVSYNLCRRINQSRS